MAAKSSDFDGLAAPARRALASAGFKTLEDPAGAREAQVARLHGMGPNALKRLRENLAAKGLTFRP